MHSSVLGFVSSLRCSLNKTPIMQMPLSCCNLKLGVFTTALKWQSDSMPVEISPLNFLSIFLVGEALSSMLLSSTVISCFLMV